MVAVVREPRSSWKPIAKSPVKPEPEREPEPKIEPPPRPSALRLTKSFVKSVCPPAIWWAARWAMRCDQRAAALAAAHARAHAELLAAEAARAAAAAEAAGPRRIRTLAELDLEIARCEQSRLISDDAYRASMQTFVFDPDITLPEDPDSVEYRDAQMRLYHMIAGRDTYSALDNEQTEFDFETHVKKPFPYCTGNSNMVGEHLLAIGLLFRKLDLPPGGRILEFGIGFGKTTIEFAQMGYQVTGVDVNERFLDLNRRRCAMLDVPVELVKAEMLEFESSRPFDRIVFYECFHHCMDPNAMIARLDRLVAPGGAIVFAGEPIYPQCPVPWGVRLDGISVLSIRKYGWLELGFHPDYFTHLLARHGWTAATHFAPEVPHQTIIIARRVSESAPTI